MRYPPHWFFFDVIIFAAFVVLLCSCAPVKPLIRLSCADEGKAPAQAPVISKGDCLIFYDTKGQLQQICGGTCGVKP